MADLYDGQFELDGVTFGLDCPVWVTDDGFKPQTAELIGGSRKIAGGDGVRFGRRRRGSATWSFKLFTNDEEGATALASYAALGRAWPSEDVRLSLGEVSALRYALGGRTRVIFGQGGRWTPVVGNELFGGHLGAAADFETVDHLHYGDEVFSEAIPIGASSGGGGFEVPFTPPFTTLGTNGPRAGQITIGGDSPTPVWITFAAGSGATLVDPKVTVVGGWTAEVLDTVYSGDPVTVDARVWRRSATRASGGAVLVNPRVTKISKMYLEPGTYNLNFTGTDSTATAVATVNWRNAYSHL